MSDNNIKDLKERLSKETPDNAQKMLYMWVKQDIISLKEFRLVCNYSPDEAPETFS